MRVECTVPQDVLDDYEMDLTEGEVYEVISTHSDCIFVVGNKGVQECLEEDEWMEV